MLQYSNILNLLLQDACHGLTFMDFNHENAKGRNHEIEELIPLTEPAEVSENKGRLVLGISTDYADYTEGKDDRLSAPRDGASQCYHIGIYGDLNAKK